MKVSERTFKSVVRSNTWEQELQDSRKKFEDTEEGQAEVFWRQVDALGERQESLRTGQRYVDYQFLLLCEGAAHKV